MSILIFIIVLGILILVHELGHFIVAKKTGMLVEEFAIGFPPRLFSFQKGETKYSIGLIPLGGFVKIFGEDYAMANALDDDKRVRCFTNKPKWAQALVLVAGVFFNLLLAWGLISVGFMSGLPVSVSQFTGETIDNPELILVDILPDSPAEKAGLQAGDIILSLGVGKSESIQDFKNSASATNFIASRGGREIEVLYKRGPETSLVHLTPEQGIIENKFAIGVSLDVVGTVKFPIHRAFWEGLKATIFWTSATAAGLFGFLLSAVTGQADLSQISGPIGIISLVGNAFQFGFVYLLSFVAIISINLAVINLIPIPALDGGRLLFVLIEAVKGSPIKPRLANALNLAGFAFLILLMIIITASDVFKLF
ncbi:MAG: RIP metalloprotease RseP [Candidatus Pacebacteria bacterium]|nr:RIP metalloprotease RseP [Candidatus Paceibacterota bacterium]